MIGEKEKIVDVIGRKNLGLFTRHLTINQLRVSILEQQIQTATEILRQTTSRIGTVDKFQGQEAPIVIYSMTTSSHADAPRGMEFLNSLNRLNVATSRTKCICVLVALALRLRSTV